MSEGDRFLAGTAGTVAIFAFVALSWGGSFAAIAIGLEQLPPATFAGFRLLSGAAVVLPAIALYYDDWIPRRRGDLLGVAVAAALVMGGSNGLLFAGQQYTTSALAAVLFAMNPLLVSLFAWLFISAEQVTRREAVGVVVGLVGVAITVNLSPSAIADSQVVGALLVFGGATALSLGSAVTRAFETSLPNVVIVGWGMALGGSCLEVVGALRGEPFPTELSVTLVGAVLYLGVFSTAGAFSAYYELLDRVGAVRTALVSYTVPVVTVLVGWLYLQEDIALRTLLGFAVITTGFVISVADQFSIRQ